MTEPAPSLGPIEAHPAKRNDSASVPTIHDFMTDLLSVTNFLSFNLDEREGEKFNGERGIPREASHSIRVLSRK
jgi:hypothetical protein